MKSKKRLLLIGAGLEQKIAINLAKKMGLVTIAVDNNKKAVGLKNADIPIVEDTSNIKKLVAIGKKYQVDGIITHAVDIPFIVSSVAEALKLPHLDPAVAHKATDKIERIKCFKKAKLPVPKFETARDLKEARRKISKIGLPVVMKPSDNAGARGVIKVSKESEIEKSYKIAQEYSHTKEILIEQYLKGSEISTETFVYENSMITTGFADRNYSRVKEFHPYFVEDGHSVPSVLSNRLKQKIIAAVETSIKVLGINWGVAKGDILITKNETVYVLEMAPRTSGGWFAAGTVPLATGVNLLKPFIKIAVGEKPDENDFKHKYNRAACQRYIIPNKTGHFDKLIGVKKARRMPGVKVLQLFRIPKKGARINKATNNSERYGHLIAIGKDVREATKNCEDATSKIKIVTI